MVGGGGEGGYRTNLAKIDQLHQKRFNEFKLEFVNAIQCTARSELRYSYENGTSVDNERRENEKTTNQTSQT